MAKAKNIGIVLSENDKSIIAWFNMLQKAGESPRTWVQAVLLADSLKMDMDVGTVYVPKKKTPQQLKTLSSRHLMFGDDTVDNKKRTKCTYGWSIKGQNNEYVADNIFCFRVSRAALIPVLDDIYARQSNISSYIKAILRKYIKVTETEQEAQVPDRTAMLDLFALNSIQKVDAFQIKTECEPKKQVNENSINKPTVRDSAETVTDVQDEKPAKSKNPLLQYIN